MDRRLLALGVLMLLFGMLSSYQSGQVLLSGISEANNTARGEVVLGLGGSGSAPLQLNTTSIAEVTYTSTNAIDFYIVNASAFTAIGQSLNSTNALQEGAVAQEGRGTVVMIDGNVSGVFPYQAAYAGVFPQPNYTAPGNGTLPSGTYYVVFSNPGSTNATVFYSLFSTPAASVGLTHGGSFGYGLLGGLLILVGAGLVIYSFFMRREKTDEVKATEENVQREYDEIEERNAKREYARIERRGAQGGSAASRRRGGMAGKRTVGRKGDAAGRRQRQGRKRQDR